MYKQLREVVSHGDTTLGYTAEVYLVERGMEHLWTSFHPLASVETSEKSLVPCDRKIIAKSIPKRLLFAYFHNVARLINTPTEGFIVVRSALINRVKLMRNYLITWN